MSFRFNLKQIDQAVDYLDEQLQTLVICFDGPMGAWGFFFQCNTQ
jgi:hypothetical protein